MERGPEAGVVEKGIGGAEDDGVDGLARGIDIEGDLDGGAEFGEGERVGVFEGAGFDDERRAAGGEGVGGRGVSVFGMEIQGDGEAGGGGQAVALDDFEGPLADGVEGSGFEPGVGGFEHARVVNPAVAGDEEIDGGVAGQFRFGGAGVIQFRQRCERVKKVDFFGRLGFEGERPDGAGQAELALDGAALVDGGFEAPLADDAEEFGAEVVVDFERGAVFGAAAVGAGFFRVDGGDGEHLAGRGNFDDDVGEGFIGVGEEADEAVVGEKDGGRVEEEGVVLSGVDGSGEAVDQAPGESFRGLAVAEGRSGFPVRQQIGRENPADAGQPIRGFDRAIGPDPGTDEIEGAVANLFQFAGVTEFESVAIGAEGDGAAIPGEKDRIADDDAGSGPRQRQAENRNQADPSEVAGGLAADEAGRDEAGTGAGKDHSGAGTGSGGGG